MYAASGPRSRSEHSQRPLRRGQRPDERGRLEHQEGVHARFLAVEDLERIERCEQGGEEGELHPNRDAARSRPISSPSAVDDCNRQQAGKRREAPHPPGGVGEAPAPQFQQPVVAGRVDVGGGVDGDAGEAALRQRPGVALVVPQRGTGEAVETEKCCQRQNGDEVWRHRTGSIAPSSFAILYCSPRAAI